MLEEKDQQIVRALADGIPFVPRPYAVLAEKAGIEEAEFLSRMKKLKEQTDKRLLRIEIVIGLLISVVFFVLIFIVLSAVLYIVGFAYKMKKSH